MVGRRTVMQALGAAAVSGEVDAPEHAKSEQPDSGLPSLEITTKSTRWANRQLRNQYGAAWYKPPSRGIYFHYTDKSLGLASRDALVQRAQVVAELSEPRYEVDAWDCEDQSMRLRQRMVALNPRLNVGVMFNHSGDHAYNVLLTAEGDVVEFEPHTGEVSPDRLEQDKYEPTEGIMML